MIKISIPAGCLIKDSNSQALVTQNCLLHTKYIIIRCVLATFKALWKFFSCVLRATLGGGTAGATGPGLLVLPCGWVLSLGFSGRTMTTGKNNALLNQTKTDCFSILVLFLSISYARFWVHTHLFHYALYLIYSCRVCLYFHYWFTTLRHF